MSAWIYPISLLAISVFVAVLEWRFPKRDQPQLRRRLWSDALYLVFNGHFLGVILFGLAANYVLPYVDSWLTQAGWIDALYRGAASAWPIWVQIAVALVVIDLLQWCVHNLLHRVPLLWEMHKTHHSVVDGEMDWIVAFRFQWSEVIVYRTVLYLPLAWFGFGIEAVLTHAIFGTLIGHLNHANLDLSWGPLRYVLNSPNMHIWHHDYDGDAKSTVNFGIIFSCWDWIFGSAKMPPRDPDHIGFAGVETFPDTFFGQMAWPISKLSRRKAFGVVAGVLVIGGGWVAAQPRAQVNHTPMMGETTAESQPTQSPAPQSAYAASPSAADAALARFGTQAAADGLAQPGTLVSASELAAALGAPKLVVLDVRKPDRYLAGHIPSAVQLDRPDYSGGDIPGLSRDAEALQAMLRRLGVRPDSVVVAYTDGGPEAIRLWWTLRMIAGYDIRLLDGGLQRWNYAGHALAQGQREGTPGDVVLPAARAPSLWPAVETFRRAHPDALLVDTRTQAEFDGKTQRKSAARAGRIPGAQRLDWASMFRDPQSDHRLKTRAQLDALLAPLIDKPVVLYCQSATRSAAVYFALLQAGHPEARVLNYDGSWAEYSRLDLPKAP